MRTPAKSIHTVQYPIAGALAVDLTDLDRWPDENVVRRRLWAIESMPNGTQVRLMVGGVSPSSYMADGISISHVVIVVEASEPDLIRRWIGMLREIVG